MLQRIFSLVLVLCPLTALGQIPAVRAGSREALRAAAESRTAPAPIGPALSLRDIENKRVEPGNEGIPWHGEGVLGVLNTSYFPVLQVLDDENLLINANGKVWWLQMPTAGIADDTKVNLQRKVFAFVGTKRYETELGMKTVFHLKYVREHEVVKVKEPPKFKGRVWTDDTGMHSVTAEFVSFENGKVVLRKEDGKELKISPAKLSAKDVKWYRDVLRERNRGD